MVPYLAKISEFASALRFSELSPEVVRRTKFVLLDTIGVIAAGAQEAEIAAFAGQLDVPVGPTTLFGQDHTTDSLNGALINGTAGTFLELDEGNQFCRGHAAIHVVPALLALAEERGLSGREVIVALVAGYEIAARIGIASKIRMSMHPHGTWGTVGAAVAVGRAAKLDPVAMGELINISSSMGLATSRKTMLEGATVRNVYAGLSNYMGLLALKLHKAGFTGEKDGLTTVYGSVISDSFDQAALLEDLGSRFEISRNYFKMHACCRYNHSALDALLEIASRFPNGNIPVENVAEVRVETYSLAAQLCDSKPRNMLAAKFSIPFAIATCLTHGSTGVDTFRQEKVNDSAIISLAQKVKVLEKTEYTAMMPERRPSRVMLCMKDGTTNTAETFLNKGDFEAPYSDSKIHEKFLGLAKNVWGSSRSEEILAKLMHFETIENIHSITSMLGR
jgi:2-methylcitrate dehydratase PrpD